jgi:DNA-binding HxlR family transcriptional regulator
MHEVEATKLRQATHVLQILQGKWTLQILWAMRENPIRLSELKRAIPSASKKALTSGLRSLEAARIIVRTDLSGAVLHVEYSLTDEVGTSLVALVDHIIAWSVGYDSKYVDEGASSRSELRISRSER